MRAGIVSYWFNRGQATVGRFLRSALEELGCETFLLARPPPSRFFRGGIISKRDVWDQKRVTAASAYEIPVEEYLDWGAKCRLDVVFCDQNYQFEEIGALRDSGIRTIGRFVWESFGAEHAPSARTAFDTIYSLTRCEQERYAGWGIQTPFVPWGCHPELLRYADDRKSKAPTFFYPGGYLSLRKPTAAVVEAFLRAEVPGARLLVKTQCPPRVRDLKNPSTWDEANAWRRDPDMDAPLDAKRLTQMPGVVFNWRDLDTRDYYRLFSSCLLCIAPSRWEGLGLHLYETTAFGLPCLCNDMPPLSEIVQNGRNGLLTSSRVIGERANGLPIHEPDVDGLANAIGSALENYQDLQAGTRARREELSWDRTVDALKSLLKS